ncbi:MAG: hypothetical protein ACLQVF_24420 [Isosphaeraceae bacterium]
MTAAQMAAGRRHDATGRRHEAGGMVGQDGRTVGKPGAGDGPLRSVAAAGRALGRRASRGESGGVAERRAGGCGEWR